MNYKKAKILAIIIRTLFYIVTLLMWLLILYSGILGVTMLIKAFSIKDIIIILAVAIFLYWIL